MVLLATENDRRSFLRDEPIGGELLVSHFGSSDLNPSSLSIELSRNESSPNRIWEKSIPLEPLAVGELSGGKPFAAEAASLNSSGPVRVVLRSRLTVDDKVVARNHWPIWLFPKTAAPNGWHVVRHSSFDIPAKSIGMTELPDWKETDDIGRTIVLARKFDDRLLTFLKEGGRVLMIPNNERGSFATAEQWFLRGGPLALPLATRFAFDDAADLDDEDSKLVGAQMRLTCWPKRHRDYSRNCSTLTGLGRSSRKSTDGCQGFDRCWSCGTITI